MKIINLLISLIALASLNQKLTQGIPASINNENDVAVVSQETNTLQLETSDPLDFTVTELTEIKEAVDTLNTNHELLKRSVLEERDIGDDIRGIVNKAVDELTDKAKWYIDRLKNKDLKEEAGRILSEGIREINEKLDYMDSLERQYGRCKGFWRHVCRGWVRTKMVSYFFSLPAQVAVIIAKTIGKLASLPVTP